MSESRRATIYFDAEVHRAVRLMAAATEHTISDVVNAAVRVALAEDAEDLEALDERNAEESIDFETFVKALKKRGRL